MSLVEKSLIDCGIVSLLDVDISASVVYLNCHCNLLQRIDHLSHLTRLKYLDLSSNHIRKITGLQHCQQLTFLNLSCNQIQKVEGLTALRNIRHIDLSYNKIADISGLSGFRRTAFALHRVDLFGNQITSLKHVFESLRNSTSITTLLLQRDHDNNPVCSVPGYRANILAQLPFIQNLDGTDKNGRPVAVQADVDIPGLEEFLEVIKPSLTEELSLKRPSESSSAPSDVITPKIDSVLMRFKNRNEDENSANLKVEKERINERVVDDRLGERMELLEERLFTLVDLYTKKEEMEKVVQFVDDSTSSSTDVPPLRELKPRNKTVKSSNKKSTNKPQNTKKNQKSTNKLTDSSMKENVRSVKDDETCVSLMREIDGERERRWKAEQAARKLVDNVKQLQERVVEERKLQEAAIASAAKLKQAYASEKEAREKIEERWQKCEKENTTLKNEVETLRTSNSENITLVKQLQETLAKTEKETTKQILHQKCAFKELQLEMGGSGRELELLRSSEEKYKQQLHQMQQLLVQLEQQHQKQMEGLVSIESEEVNERMEKEIDKEKSRCNQTVAVHLQRLNDKSQAYSELEEEFRMALQIESNRYNQLLELHDQNVTEMNDLKSSFEERTKKEANARKLVADLSAMVKEQKSKISAITESKKETTLQYKERIKCLEEEIASIRGNASTVQILHQDKERLTSHIRGQDSVIQGLRAERKLWGHELAQQGSALAKERGELYAQLDSLKKQVQEFDKNLQEKEDSLKIKTKLIDDQTETIKTNKKELASLNHRLKADGEEWNKEKNLLEEELFQERRKVDELNSTVEELIDRKEELKLLLSEAEDSSKQSKQQLVSMKEKWSERSEMIRKMEIKVNEMKTTFHEKESKLNKQNNQLKQELGVLNEKLVGLEKSHEKHMVSLKHEYELQTREVINQKEDEIQANKNKVMQVEEEMRELLKQTTSQKKCLEEKIVCLSHAFKDIQNHL